MKTHRDLKPAKVYQLEAGQSVFHENPQGFETLSLQKGLYLHDHFMKTHRDLKL